MEKQGTVPKPAARWMAESPWALNSARYSLICFRLRWWIKRSTLSQSAISTAVKSFRFQRLCLLSFFLCFFPRSLLLAREFGASWPSLRLFRCVSVFGLRVLILGLFEEGNRTNPKKSGNVGKETSGEPEALNFKGEFENKHTTINRAEPRQQQVHFCTIDRKIATNTAHNGRQL